MKLSVNETKLTGLWARNCASIQQVWILKFVVWPEKPRKGRKETGRAWGETRDQILRTWKSVIDLFVR